MIDEKLCNELHDQLVADRERLQREIELLGSGGIRSDVFGTDEQDNVDQHPADQGSELFEREKNLTVQRTLEINLQEVNDALQKFDEGTYGLCASCNKPIAEKRLRALPAATHCIECQAKLERMAQLTAR